MQLKFGYSTPRSISQFKSVDPMDFEQSNLRVSTMAHTTPDRHENEL